MQSTKLIPCDRCHARKVRCDYASPCIRCQNIGHPCTYLLVRKKRGPKRQKRAAGAENQPESQQQTPLPISQASPERNEHGVHDVSLPAFSDAPDASLMPPPAHAWEEPHHQGWNHTLLSFDTFAQTVLADDFFLHGSAPLPSVPVEELLGQPTPSVLNPSTPFELGTSGTPRTGVAEQLTDVDDKLHVTPIVERAIDLFSEHLYPVYPLLQRERLEEIIRNANTASNTEKALIWSMCATTLANVNGWPSLGAEQRAVSARRYIRKYNRANLDRDIEKAQYEDVVAAIFVANAFFELRQRRTSWFYIREAISLAIAAGLDTPATYAELDVETATKYRRAYALVFISERGAAMFNYYPVSMVDPPSLPCTPLEGEDPTVAVGLSALHNLFSLLDHSFVQLWNNVHMGTAHDSNLEDLRRLQQHLRQADLGHGLSDIQRADVLITQHWLRLLFWQAGLSQGLVSSNATDEAFSYTYPCTIAVDLCHVLRTLPPIAIEVHGLGIFEKQFEIAYSLMDTLALSGSSQPELHECLRFLLLTLSASPNARQVYVRTLKDAIGGQHRYRSLAGVELLREDGGLSRDPSRRHSVARVTEKPG